MFRYRIVAFLFVAACAMSPQVVAWEVDVHYVLTCWLAERAGYSRADAQEIAQADQGMDESEHHAAIPTMVWIILRGDLGAAQDLQDHHFPSGARLPAPPQSRVVRPGDQWARDAVDSAVRIGQAEPSLRKLGEALHPFQDSWSHQGVPDVPLGLRPELSCAHPVARGGWRSHDAVQHAHETYKILLEFLTRYPRFRSHPSRSWVDLERMVREFAKARTRKDKDDWAVKSIDAGPRSLSIGLTLAGGRENLLGRTIRPRDKSSNPAPPELIDSARKLSETWFRTQNMEAASAFVDWSLLAGIESHGGRTVRTLAAERNDQYGIDPFA